MGRATNAQLHQNCSGGGPAGSGWGWMSLPGEAEGSASSVPEPAAAPPRSRPLTPPMLAAEKEEGGNDTGAEAGGAERPPPLEIPADATDNASISPEPLVRRQSQRPAPSGPPPGLTVEIQASNRSASSSPRTSQSVSPSATGSGSMWRRPSLSPQSWQQSIAKQIEELCSQSVHAAARYGDESKLQDHIRARPNAACADRDDAGFSPLHFAACYGHADAVSLLLEAKAEADAASEHGWTPLHMAARNGHEPCVTKLIEGKASVHFQDLQKMTALHNASCSESQPCVEVLLLHGADCNALDSDSWTPLHFAARFNNVDAVKLLLEKSANPNVQDRDGWTALHNCARNGRNKCVQALLEAEQTDLKMRTRYGETPLHIACRKGKMRVVEKIVQHADSQPKVDGKDFLGLLRELEDHDQRTPEEVCVCVSVSVKFHWLPVVTGCGMSTMPHPHPHSRRLLHTQVCGDGPGAEDIRRLLKREKFRGSAYDVMGEESMNVKNEGGETARQKKSAGGCALM